MPDAAPEEGLRIGVDVGGTKIEAVAIGPDGAARARRRVPTPRAYDATLGAIAALVADVEREAGLGAAAPNGALATVGVGIPGSLGPASGLVQNANSTWLIGRPFGDDLAARLGRPVRVANDADCFALSEATDGAAAGAGVVFGVILGTGVGGGLVVGGRLLAGPNRIAGEWGHNALPRPAEGEWPGPPCYCGRTGCIETFLSGPAFEREFAVRTGSAGPGGALGAREIARRAAGGDAGAAAHLARYAERLGRALASVVNVLDPDVVVLGGGMSNLPGLAEAARAALVPHVFAEAVATRVVPNAHGDSSGVRGAAWLWPQPSRSSSNSSAPAARPSLSSLPPS